MVIFWPPVFGLTVNVLDAAHFILNKVLRKNIQLHPRKSPGYFQGTNEADLRKSGI
jgi:hypothetical protein